MLRTTYHEGELPTIAKRVAKELQPGDVVTFTGELAAGKTTLIRDITKALGYLGTVNSPTFVIEHRYPLRKKGLREIIHLDLYRLNDSDLASLDWEDYRDPQVITFIEWPAIARSHLPEHTKTITLKKIDAKTREITFG